MLQGEEYSKESQILVEEIKKTIHGNLCVFKKHQEHDKSPSAVKVDLLLCLEVVDAIQSLDLKQHFSEDMKCILDYLFRCVEYTYHTFFQPRTLT